MSMCSIDNDSVCTGIYQRLHTNHSISCHTYTSSNTQTALAILASHRFILGLCNILISNQTNQLALIIHYRQLFNLVFLQDLSSSFHIGTLMSRDDIFLAHHFINMLVHIEFETEVTVSYDTDQVVFIIDNWNTANMILSHQIQRILHSRTTFDGNRIKNHTVFGTLHDSHLTSLFFN